MDIQDKIDQLKRDLQAEANNFNKLKQRRDKIQRNLVQIKEEIIGISRSIKEIEDLKEDKDKEDKNKKVDSS